MNCSCCGQVTTQVNSSGIETKMEPKGIRNIISEKLGRCWKCILIAFLGTVLGWFLFYVVFFQISNPPFVLFLMAILCAGSFTLAFVAHIVAYFLKRNQ